MTAFLRQFAANHTVGNIDLTTIRRGKKRIYADSSVVGSDDMTESPN